MKSVSTENIDITYVQNSLLCDGKLSAQFVYNASLSWNT